MDDQLVFEIEADELDLFTQEVNEHLRAIEAGILSLEQWRGRGEMPDPETLNATFRAAHTLKAVVGAVGHQRMAELTHATENIFAAMRDARLSLTPGVADELLATVDVLRRLRDEVITRQPSGVDIVPLLARLNALVTSEPSSPFTGKDRRELTPDQINRLKDYRATGNNILEISAVVGADAFAPAARLLQVAMALAEAGQVIAQHPSQEDLLNGCHDRCLWLMLATPSGPEEIESLLGEITELAEVQVRLYTADTVSPQPGRGYNPTGADEEKTVHISVERLDTLMDLVGEMVTDRTRLVQIKESLRAQLGKGRQVAALDETIAHLSQMIDQLQDEVMQARMLPISHLFDKFPRLVRDVARAAGKQVDLVIEGETTELDRSIIEAIGDPLVHLLRNAVDHGIEPPEARVAAGKSPVGRVRLAAEHAEGQIVITVQDDGRGVAPERIRQAAVDAGLLSEKEAAHLSDDEAIALIFRPGLSTTEQVSNVSGRGVGLDVVRTNVGRIGGSVAVESEVGRGTTFRVTLPLTLAIVQTMLVALKDDLYAIPLTSIIESLYLSEVTVQGVKGNPAIRWRNEVLPLLDLGHFFGLGRVQSPAAGQTEAAAQGNHRPAVVIVTWGNLRAGLVVDRIVAKQEIVVKPFGPLIGNVPGLSGCTILGDGRIALIADIPGLINTAVQARTQQVNQTRQREAT